MLRNNRFLWFVFTSVFCIVLFASARNAYGVIGETITLVSDRTQLDQEGNSYGESATYNANKVKFLSGKNVYEWNKSTAEVTVIANGILAGKSKTNLRISPSGKYLIFEGTFYELKLFDFSTQQSRDLIPGSTLTNVGAMSLSQTDRFVLLENGSSSKVNNCHFSYLLLDLENGTQKCLSDIGIPQNAGKAVIKGNFLYAFTTDKGYQYDLTTFSLSELHFFPGQAITFEMAPDSIAVDGSAMLFPAVTADPTCGNMFIWVKSTGISTCIYKDSPFYADGGDTGDTTIVGPEGRYILFPHGVELYLYDVTLNKDFLVTKNTAGQPSGHDVNDSYDFTADEHHVIFESNDPNLVNGNDNPSNYFDVYLYSFEDTLTTPTATPTQTPESSFSVTKDAWNFPNARYHINWANFQAAFGNDQTLDKNGKPSQVAQYQFKKERYAKKANGGMCFGYNLTAAKIYADMPSGFTLPEGFIQDNVFDVPSPQKDVLDYLKQGTLGDYLVTYHLYQYGKEFLTAYDQSQQLTLNDMLSVIKGSIDDNLKDPPMLVIELINDLPLRLFRECSAHVVMPYKYNNVADGTDLWVYDSNHPGEEMKMHFNSDMSWSYDHYNSSQTCYLNWRELVGRDPMRTPHLTLVEASTFAATRPTLVTSKQGGNVSLLELTDAAMNPAENMLPFLPLMGSSELEDELSETLIVSGTSPVVQGTIYYTNSENADVTLLGPGVAIGLSSSNTTKEMTDQIMMDTTQARVVITAGTTLTRSVQSIITIGDVEQTTSTTCSYPASSKTIIATDREKTVVAPTSTLSRCLFTYQITGQDELTYTLPVLPAGSTVALSVLSDQASQLSVALDNDSNGSTDLTILVPHESKPESVYLPLIVR